MLKSVGRPQEHFNRAILLRPKIGDALLSELLQNRPQRI